MGDRTNRYKSLEKRAAYEAALQLASQIKDLKPGAYWGIFGRLDHNLSCEDRRQVAAKAVRVERGRRIQKA